MRYNDFFNKILLENAELPAGQNARIHDNGSEEDAMKGFLDELTPTDSFDTNGMPDIEADLDGFNQQIQEFKQAREKFQKKAQTLFDFYSNALDELDDPNAVSAKAIKIRDSVGGIRQLENIVKNLDDIVKRSIEKGSTEQIERIIQTRPQEGGEEASMMKGPEGMSFSESFKRKKKVTEGTHRYKEYPHYIDLAQELGCGIKPTKKGHIIFAPSHIAKDLPLSYRQESFDRGDKAVPYIVRYLRNKLGFRHPDLIS